MIAPTRLSSRDKPLPHLRMFSGALRLAWVVISIVTIWSEIMPRSPGLLPLPYYSYTLAKVILFVLIGFLSPLTFWRFDSLGLGLLFSILVAGAVEGIQSVSLGHRASYFEFAAKLILLFIGFAYALNARYDRELRLGPLRVFLRDSHHTAAE